jgi:hypothetical protein
MDLLQEQHVEHLRRIAGQVLHGTDINSKIDQQQHAAAALSASMVSPLQSKIQLFAVAFRVLLQHNVNQSTVPSWSSSSSQSRVTLPT